MKGLASIILVLFGSALLAGGAAAQDERIGVTPGSPAGLALDLFSNQYDVRQSAIGRFIDRSNSSDAAALIMALRFARDPGLFRALETITGVANGSSWNESMLWQEAHPEIAPFEGFDAFKANTAQRIPLGGWFGDPDRDFAPVMVFLASDSARFLTGPTYAVDGGMLMMKA